MLSCSPFQPGKPAQNATFNLDEDRATLWPLQKC